jgi:hypothetical protein
MGDPPSREQKILLAVVSPPVLIAALIALSLAAPRWW